MTFRFSRSGLSTLPGAASSPTRPAVPDIRFVRQKSRGFGMRQPGPRRHVCLCVHVVRTAQRIEALWVRIDGRHETCGRPLRFDSLFAISCLRRDVGTNGTTSNSLSYRCLPGVAVSRPTLLLASGAIVRALRECARQSAALLQTGHIEDIS